jgi:predicted  nucleic acid-binding Zn-ribbon protein
MAAAKDAGKVSEENAALRVQVSDLTEQLQAMRSRLAALENSDEARRGPGRPRKEAA